MDATTYITTHNSTISDDQTMDSGVLAGPVAISGTLTVTGNIGGNVMSTLEVDKDNSHNQEQCTDSVNLVIQLHYQNYPRVQYLIQS